MFKEEDFFLRRKVMKRQLSEIEALMNKKYFESRVDMIPASLKVISSKVSGKEVIVARELIIDDRVFLGVEYTPDGDIVGAYTTDAKGRHIKVESSYEKTPDNRTPQNLISERLEEVSRTLAQENGKKQAESAKEAPAPAKKVVARRKLKDEEIRRKQLEDYKNNRRGC